MGKRIGDFTLFNGFVTESAAEDFGVTLKDDFVVVQVLEKGVALVKGAEALAYTVLARSQVEFLLDNFGQDNPLEVSYVTERADGNEG